MQERALVAQQLDDKMQLFASLRQIAIPPTGWIKAIRIALGMSLLQLGRKLNDITKQSVRELEEREKNGSITIKSLREVAKALDMQLVYGFVPDDGSLDALIERKANELATKIVLRVSNSMKLEDQGISEQRIEKAIEERTETIKKEVPKILWD
jgi:predicted DNA-binding mobile mystery protein A